MHETDELIVSKTKLSIENGLNVIFCFGETLEGMLSSYLFRKKEQ